MSRCDDAHMKILQRAVELLTEFFDLFLILRDQRSVLGRGADPFLDSVEPSGRSRAVMTCLNRQLNLLKRAARRGETDE
jgi:hypothetical protein